MDLVYLSTIAATVIVILLTITLLFTLKKLKSVTAADNAKLAQLERFAPIMNAEGRC